jgi:hypothetical protein
MEDLKIGSHYLIHCYKHNKQIYKVWEEAVLLDIKDNCLIFGNNRTRVIEADGRSWRTREPAVMYFFTDKWYNIIGQYKKDGIQYYCNIASPFVLDGKAVKYIDYDLDLRVFPDGGFRVLDRNEYKYHKKLMHYSDDLDLVLRSELSKLIEEKRKNTGPFKKETIDKYYQKYKELQKK